ncbi:hypothetical protein [Bacillus altitudinis]|uniref:hypothetical protein n=2 Tax=Bacillaceae TaxID=186817 RepID=UPI000922860A|nr:hypothetical protein [Bacillus altitudinis]MEE3612403.1 hypothetical protein [Bacillus altitudinis]MEE3648096.1 hypothetical protein [Bacillus altitudinis]SFX00103.1 hypothetical protein SAMN04487921_101155 [Bacillus altitudinis]SNR81429.1 hypothetical protein SAMN05880584_101247 [Bacillus altitudinis]VXB42279.1 conserved hypothetical protein [Bacillus altitudinis]
MFTSMNHLKNMNCLVGSGKDGGFRRRLDQSIKERQRETLNKEGYVLKVSEDDILVRFLSGNTLVDPKSWDENLDEALTEDDLKALIDLSLDLRDEHFFKMCVRDLQALQGK